MASQYEKNSFDGKLIGVDGDKLIIDAGGQQPRTVWLGKSWDGEKPQVGIYAQWDCARAPAKPGRQFGSNYLDDWTPKQEPAGGSEGRSNGTASATRNEDFLAARWAISAAIDARTAEIVVDDKLILEASLLFQAAKDLSAPPPKPEQSKDGWADDGSVPESQVVPF